MDASFYVFVFFMTVIIVAFVSDMYKTYCTHKRLEAILEEKRRAGCADDCKAAHGYCNDRNQS